MEKHNKISSCLFLALFSLCHGNLTAQSMAAQPQFVDLFVRPSNKGCFRIPALATAPNGDLIAAVDDRSLSCADLRGNRDINIHIRRSKDNGKTWSVPETMVDYPLGQSASDPSFIVDDISKRVFLLFNFMDVDKEKDVYHFKSISSKDNGKSWSPAKDITTQISQPDWRSDFQFITSGNGIQLASGTLLHTLVNLKRGVILFGSKNHGKTWFVMDTPIQPGDESKVVELIDGSLMVNSRVNESGFRYIHKSSNQGKFWSSVADSALPDPGCNASIIRYTSGKEKSPPNRLLFSNPQSSEKRENLAVRISYDEGKTWSAGKTIYKGSSAYSSLRILKNGDIGLLFERDDYHKITFVRLTLPWLTDGKDGLTTKFKED